MTTRFARLSLRMRLVVAASVVLVAFLGMTGAALDRAFRDNSLALIEERLQAQTYALLAAAEHSESGLYLPDELPEPRFSTPASGLYAEVFDDLGESRWRSSSMLGMHLPAPPSTEPGVPTFNVVRAADTVELFVLTFPVRWEMSDGADVGYIFQIAERRQNFDRRLRRFRRNLWGWLAGATVALAAVQGLVLTLSLRPIARVAQEVTEIENGDRDQLSQNYPPELEPLAANLNALIRVGRRQLERYRNQLADLAHSLKTPLAVLHGATDREVDEGALGETVREQVQRMDRSIEYQLKRAATSGRLILAPSIDVVELVEKLRASLAKVYADKRLDIVIDAEHAVWARADEGDLMELLGNLMDNACKWATGQVRVSLSVSAPGDNRSRTGARPMLALAVDDDGPGIAPEQVALILSRGGRADSQQPGHGIGLAVVHELVTEAYFGTLSVEESALGGARVSAQLDCGVGDADLSRDRTPDATTPPRGR